ncbi:MAG TPA: MaoC family dehydratase [Candidatus Nanoarchaeia archaeon]|nr:MaoC family dehydratase [Candidatus Nanoarchaeia archaeon]
MRLFAGIGAWFKKSPEEAEELEKSLEEKINKTLARDREKIVPTREQIGLFGRITGDSNPIHIDPTIAQKYGFTDTPVMGAHIAAFGSEYINGVNNTLKEECKVDYLKLVEQRTRIPKAIYPGQPITWNVEKQRIRGSGERIEEIMLDISGVVNGEKAVGIEGKLNGGYASPEIPSLPLSIIMKTYTLGQDELKILCDCIGAPYNEKMLIPQSFGFAYVPATLLELLQRETKTKEGINLVMESKTLGHIHPGSIQVDAFLKQKRESRGSFIYTIETVIAQRDSNGLLVPKLVGEIKCGTSYNLNLTPADPLATEIYAHQYLPPSPPVQS